MSAKPKGIFCLETGAWYGRLDDRTTVRPVLELLEHSTLKVPYIFRDVDTIEEFHLYLKKWVGRMYRRYPILYLGFHGSEGAIYVGDGRRRESTVSIQSLGDMLGGRCHGKLIHFGSCSTLDLHGRRVTTFLEKTGALAVCGYKEDVEWFESSAFEVFLLGLLQGNAFTRSGARAIRNRIDEIQPRMRDLLGFVMRIQGDPA